MNALRVALVVVFACIVGAAVAYVWNMDPRTPSYNPLYPTTTTASR